MSTPRLTARRDWMTVGAFDPEQFQGEQRAEYEDEALKIERQWDNKPI